MPFIFCFQKKTLEQLQPIMLQLLERPMPYFGPYRPRERLNLTVSPVSGINDAVVVRSPRE
jgi:hypothetical protein